MTGDSKVHFVADRDEVPCFPNHFMPARKRQHVIERSALAVGEAHKLIDRPLSCAEVKCTSDQKNIKKMTCVSKCSSYSMIFHVRRQATCFRCLSNLHLLEVASVALHTVIPQPELLGRLWLQ